MLLTKRGELIEQFSKNNIISKDETFYDAPKKIKKSTPEKPFFWVDRSVKRYAR